jgi:hypothetical protein
VEQQQQPPLKKKKTEDNTLKKIKKIMGLFGQELLTRESLGFNLRLQLLIKDVPG